MECDEKLGVAPDTPQDDSTLMRGGEMLNKAEPQNVFTWKVKEEPVDYEEQPPQCEVDKNRNDGVADALYAGRVIKYEPIIQNLNQELEESSSEDHTSGDVDLNSQFTKNEQEETNYRENLSSENMCIDTQSGEKRFKCHFCEKTFKLKSKLFSHVRRHTGEHPHQCKECGRGFSERRALVRHITKIHKGNKSFKCDICEKFFTKGELAWHLKTHEKPYKCETCGKGFACKDYLRIHSRLHTGERPYKCEICEATFPARSNVSTHIAMHHLNDDDAVAKFGIKNILECDTCGKRFLHKSRLSIHVMRHHSGERPFPCETCGKRFVELSKLKRHEMIHTGTRLYKCSFCNEAFPWKRHLKQHEVICRSRCDDTVNTAEESLDGQQSKKTLPDYDILLRCRQCGLMFSCKEKFVDHASCCILLDNVEQGKTVTVKLENGENLVAQQQETNDPWKCVACRKVFTEFDDLVEHINLHMLKSGHKLSDDSENENTMQCDDDVNSVTKMSSIQEGIEFTEERHDDESDSKDSIRDDAAEVYPRFMQEIEDKHQIDTEHENENDKEIQYYTREIMDDSNTAIKTNAKQGRGRPKKPDDETKPKVKKPYECTVCGEVVGYAKQTLNRHMFKHSGEKPFQCSMCGRGFTEKDTMKKHERTHTGERPYVCAQCGRGFTQRYRLTTHMRMHAGTTEYKCRICNKGFFERQTLVRHEFSHTNIRPHKCDLCAKSFKQKCELKNHKKTHLGEKPHECNICGKRFSAKFTLTSHMKKHTEFTA